MEMLERAVVRARRPLAEPLRQRVRHALAQLARVREHDRRAVLARELGIPAVVGVPGLLKSVRDGYLVRMDGAAGTVEILEAR